MSKCDLCKRERISEDKSYSPIQVITNQPVGWYSGKGEELCPECMQTILDNQ